MLSRRGAAPEPGLCCLRCSGSLGRGGSVFPVLLLLSASARGSFITLAEGLKASWCLGCFQGFQSRLEVFHCPPSPAICGNWVPETRTQLLEPIWARQPSWQVPLLHEQHQRALCLHSQHRLCPVLRAWGHAGGRDRCAGVFARSLGSVTPPVSLLQKPLESREDSGRCPSLSTSLPPLPPPRLVKPRPQTEEAELVCGF